MKRLAIALLLVFVPAYYAQQTRNLSTSYRQDYAQNTVLASKTGNATQSFNIQNGITNHFLTYTVSTGISAITVTLYGKLQSDAMYTSCDSSSVLGDTLTCTGTYYSIQVIYSGVTGTGTIDADYWGRHSAFGSGGTSGTITVEGADGSILDGVNSSIKATVKDYNNANPVTAVIVDTNGDAIVSFGGGTQYTEGDTDATITGNALLFEGAANTLVAAPGTAVDGLLVNLGANNDVTVTSGSITANAGTNLNTSSLLTTTNFTTVLGTGSLLTLTQADDLVNTTDTLTVTAFGQVFDGTTWDRMKGDSTDGLLVNLGANNDVTVTSGTITSVSQWAGTTIPLLTATLADDLVNTQDALAVANLGYVFDGSTWDRLRGTATDGMLVNLGANNDVTVTSGSITVSDGAGALNVICDSGCSGGSQYTEDAIAATDPIGNAVNLIRADTPATITNANGDNVAQRGTNYGAGFVQVVTSAGAFVDTFGGGVQYTEASTDASITGTALMLEDSGDTLVAATGNATDGLNVKVTNVVVDSADNAAFANTSTEPPVGVGGIYESSLPTYTSGDKVTMHFDVNGQLMVAGGGGGTQYTEDAAAASDPVGNMGILVATTTPGSRGANGDNIAQTGTIYGASYVTVLDTSGVAVPTATVGSGAVDSTTQRMTIATDDVLNVICDSGCAGGVQYAVDAALGANPTGTLSIAIHDNALSALGSAEGDGDGLRVDANGALWVIPSGTTIVGDGAGALNVICDSGCSGGVQYTQDAALTVATTVGTMAMGRASAAAPTDVSADNDAVIPWFLRSGAQAIQLTNAGVLTLSGSGTATGALRVELPTNGTGVIATVGAVTAITNALPAGTNAIGKLAANSGIDIGDVDITSIAAGNNNIGDVDIASIVSGTGATNLGKAEDGAHTTGDVGILQLCVRAAAATDFSVGNTDGDYEPCSVDALGKQWIVGAYTEDLGETAGGQLLMAGTVRRDTAASSAGSTGDNATLNTDGTGRLWITGTALDEAAFTYATSQVLAIGAVAESTTDALADGTVGAPVMTLNRQLRTVPTGYSTGGGTPVSYVSAGATEDEHVVCSGPCTLYSIVAMNHTAASAFLRCENDTAANTTPGSETNAAGEPDIEIPASTTGAGFVIPIPIGASFSTALTCWIVSGEAATDVAEVAANDVRVWYVKVE